MKVLLIGGTGRLSMDTTELCISKGYDVFLFNRGSKNVFNAPNVHYLIGDINNVDNAKTVLKGMKFDVVVDYLTYDLATLFKRIACFKGKMKQYVFISSATVFKPNGSVISEKSKIGNDEWEYCKKKVECENYLQNHKNEFDFAYSIVRPYITYDKNRIPFPVISKKSCWNLMYRIEKNLPILMCGDGNQKVTLTNTKDFALGITGLFGNEKAFFEDYNIVGDFVYTWNEVILELEAIMGKNVTVVNIPMDRFAREIPSFSQEVMFDKGLTHIFDNTKIKDAVPEFKPSITLHDGLQETIRHLQNEKKQHIVDEKWNAMENVVASKLHKTVVKVTLKERILYYMNESKLFMKLKVMKKIFS